MLEADITLLGASGSRAEAELREIFKPNNEYEDPPRDYASEGESMPDVFPFGRWCTSGFRRRDITSETCAALTQTEIAQHMPGLSADMTRIARELNITPAALWRRYEHNDVLYALPRDPASLISGSAIPRAILWRGDFLDELGILPPEDVGEWESAFLAFKDIHPDAVPWVSRALPVGELSPLYPAPDDSEHTIPFAPLFGAAGIHLGLVETRRGDDASTLHPWWTNPMLPTVLATLQRWYRSQLIEWTTASRPEVHRLGTGGCLVVDGVSYHRGDWITEHPLWPQTAGEIALLRNLAARVVLGPAPTFEGVERPVIGVAREMVLSDRFAFAKKNEKDRQRLHRIMRLVDTISHSEPAFLLGYYGQEGEHWEWVESGGVSYPMRLGRTQIVEYLRDLKLGGYWFHLYSTKTNPYRLDPALAASRDRYAIDPGAIYAQGPTEWNVWPVTPGALTRDENIYLSDIMNDQLGRFREVFSSIVMRGEPLHVYETYLAQWEHSTTKQELAGLLRRLSQ